MDSAKDTMYASNASLKNHRFSVASRSRVAVDLWWCVPNFIRSSHSLLALLSLMVSYSINLDTLLVLPYTNVHHSREIISHQLARKFRHSLAVVPSKPKPMIPQTAHDGPSCHCVPYTSPKTPTDHTSTGVGWLFHLRQ